MICTPPTQLHPLETKALLENHPKMQQLVESMALFLSCCLQIRSESGGREPFVEVCRKEIEYSTSCHYDGRLETLKSLRKMMDFITRSERLARTMTHCAKLAVGENMDVSGFTTDDPYFLSDELTSETSTKVCSTIPLGDIGQRLLQEIEAKALPWLDDLDSVLCVAAGINKTGDASSDKMLQGVKMDLAYAIAERLTMMSTECILNDRCSSRAFEMLLNGVYSHERPRAREQRQRDEWLVGMLQKLAFDPSGDETRSLLESELQSLQIAVKTPPKEVEIYRSEMKLNELSRALLPDIDIEVRVALVTFWAESCHISTSVLHAAMCRINEWRPADASVFQQRMLYFPHTVADDSQTRPSPSLMLPQMPFLNRPRVFACKQPHSHRGLTESGRRAECIIRAVWELSSRGYFEHGVILADIVAPVTWECMALSRLAAEIVSKSRDLNKLGTKMLAFVGTLYDMEGSHVRAIDEAACNLSHFSVMEMETAFNTNRMKTLPLMCKALTEKTRNFMTYHAHDNYSSFAIDAIGILLPLIHSRRNRIGIPTMMRTNAFLDVLRTVPKLHAWHPTSGALRLTLEDMRWAHKSCRSILDELYVKGVLVKRSGSEKSKRKLVYEFDTPTLWHLITQRMALPVSHL